MRAAGGANERTLTAMVGVGGVAGDARIGWMTSALETLAALQLTAIALLLIPWTSVLGAVLLTGYLGGAVASYVRMLTLLPVRWPRRP